MNFKAEQIQYSSWEYIYRSRNLYQLHKIKPLFSFNFRQNSEPILPQRKFEKWKQQNYPPATITWIASLTFSSSDLTASFMATSFEASIPKDSLTRTFTLPIYTPDNRHEWDLELLGTTSVPWRKKKRKEKKTSKCLSGSFQKQQ